MAKAPLFTKKFNNWFLTKMGAYPVHTSSSDVASVKKTLRYLNNDEAVCIFPEGKRVKRDESAQLKNGVVMFALKTKSPIVPARFLKRTNAFTFNKLVIGEPIFLHEMEQFKDKKLEKDLLAEASDVFTKEIQKLTRKMKQNKEKKAQN
jgi:1-acyl-sn-glycerol-3-phosphate acyltransferase